MDGAELTIRLVVERYQYFGTILAWPRQRAANMLQFCAPETLAEGYSHHMLTEMWFDVACFARLAQNRSR